MAKKTDWAIIFDRGEYISFIATQVSLLRMKRLVFTDSTLQIMNRLISRHSQRLLGKRYV
jgi:hypothetical protein